MTTRGDNVMPRSKLEKYLSILEVLVPQPLGFKKISYEADLKREMLKTYLRFLISHRLIEKHSFKKEGTVYAITDMGLAVFRTLQAKEYSERIYTSILRTHMNEAFARTADARLS
jgi:predicted transcriptional regulator